MRRDGNSRKLQHRFAATDSFSHLELNVPFVNKCHHYFTIATEQSTGMSGHAPFSPLSAE